MIRRLAKFLYKKLTDPIFDKLIRDAIKISQGEIVISNRDKTDKEIFITYCLSKHFIEQEAVRMGQR